MEGIDGKITISVPVEVMWEWDDEPSTEALITVEDPLGVQVNAWETEDFGLKVENDIQPDALQVMDEDGRQLFVGDWMRGGNISHSPAKSTSKIPLCLLLQANSTSEYWVRMSPMTEIQ